MTDEFDVSEKKFVMAKSSEGLPNYEREVCPDCVDHPQMNMTEVNRLSRELDTELDCKNLFLKDGKVVSQCCCYSIIHCIGYDELQKEPMNWFCDNCEGHSDECKGKRIQNDKPTETDCPKGLKPIWYAKRWLRYTTPDYKYVLWLHLYGTEADKILWEQEKKDRGVE